MRQFRRLQRIKLRMPAQGGAEQVKGAGREAAPVTTHERLAPRGHGVKGTPSEARRSQSDACWVEMPRSLFECAIVPLLINIPRLSGAFFPRPGPAAFSIFFESSQPPLMRIVRVPPCWARLHALHRLLSRWQGCRDFSVVAQAWLAGRSDRA